MEWFRHKAIAAWFVSVVIGLYVGTYRGYGAGPLPRPAQSGSSESAGQTEVPKGTIEGPFVLRSSVFPGTEREYWLYVPAQYHNDKPACTLVVQDGLSLATSWKLPEVLDGLIHSGEVPVTVGVFVNPGVVPAVKQGAQPRYNRSLEYDSLGDAYARFLIEELLPEVGKRFNLSSNPDHRAIAGASSGGICAFNVAWERPDAFRRVFSAIGTFVGLRGANELPVLIRKTEPKPIRVFIEDGRNDLNIYAGNWWLANQAMVSALAWAGYDVEHSWSEEGGHDGRHASVILSDAMRWLWRDFAKPLQVPNNPNRPANMDILMEGAGWQQLSSGHESVDATTCSSGGVLYFGESRAGRIFRLDEDNKTRVFKEFPSRVSAMRFGPDEKLYVVRDNKQVVRIDPSGNEELVVNDQRCHRLVTLPEGFYFTDDVTNKIFWSSYAGKVREAASLSERPVAILPTADQAFLHVALQGQQGVLNYLISEDFSLIHRQRLGHLHLPYLETSSGVSAMVVDDQGRVYVASTLGIQVVDQLGRVNLILNKPSRQPITGLTIGGPLRDTLYASDGQSVYARKLKIRGIDSFAAPVIPPKPQL